MRLGPSRLTPDYPQITVMNAALGGLFTSRISNNLREDKGFTYGAYSGFQFRRSTGTFAVRTSVRTDVTAPAVQEIFKEVRGMRDKPVGKAELDRARDSQVRSLPGEFETSAATVASFRDLFVYDLGLDPTASCLRASAQCTQSAMQALAKRTSAGKSRRRHRGDRAKIEAASRSRPRHEPIRDAVTKVVK